jgi:RNA polymerase sigma factor (sigma-70 family)
MTEQRSAMVPRGLLQSGYARPSVSGISEYERLDRESLTDVSVFSDYSDLTQLYHNDRGKLLHFCRMRISNASDAEDLVQEAFLSVGRAYPDKDGEELRALLFTTLRNLTLDYLKSGRVKAGKVTSEITDKGDTLACTRTVTPEKAMMDRQTLQQVSEILETIAPRQKQALLLSRLERLTHDEIAKRLGVSPRTVRNDITDALAAITKGLARKERGL